jgi:hypothetical protein
MKASLLIFGKLVVFFVFFPVCIFGQHVSNVNYHVDRNSIIVTYDATGCDKGCYVILKMKSFDGNSLLAKNIIGDINSITNGKSKTIKWNPLDEEIELKGDYKVVLTLCKNNIHSIGDRYLGGIVYWVHENGKHGLVTELGEVNNMTWDNAVRFCLRKGNGWHLPSLEELEKLYSSRSIIIGISNDVYWSSTEFNAEYAWYLFFLNGNSSCYSKNYLGIVRAVRSF